MWYESRIACTENLKTGMMLIKSFFASDPMMIPRGSLPSRLSSARGYEQLMVAQVDWYTVFHSHH
jgi:hypothetical protein